MSEQELNDLTLEVGDGGLDSGNDANSSSGSIKPWDNGKIRISTKSFTLREIVGQIEDNDVDLSPDFQREYVCKAHQRTAAHRVDFPRHPTPGLLLKSV